MRKSLSIALTVAVLVTPLAGFAGQEGEIGSTKTPKATTQSGPTSSTATSASAIAICGIKPPPPVGFWPDDAVCLCDGKKCKWVWMKR